MTTTPAPRPPRAKIGSPARGAASRPRQRKNGDGSTTYTNGKYSVRIGPYGEVMVQRGDWLSKYSAAIYGNFWQIGEFMRVNPQGRVIPVKDPNRSASHSPGSTPGVPRPVAR